tara:strand:+ start:599 stop:1153 length:555 start_codon:yes stop_codon:yes gene_type:complete
MTIHKSHTRKDLVEVCDVFEFHEVIENANDLNKDTLKGLLDLHLRTIEKIKEDKFYFDISDVNDLREYLKKPSPKQVLSVKQKDLILDKSKKIINYCRTCGYCLRATTYDTMEELLEDAMIIRKYCDIPTCRRAIKLLNKDTKLKNKVNPIITYRMQQRLDKKMKDGALSGMTSNVGNYILSFD